MVHGISLPWPETRPELLRGCDTGSTKQAVAKVVVAHGIQARSSQAGGAKTEAGKLWVCGPIKSLAHSLDALSGKATAGTSQPATEACPDTIFETAASTKQHALVRRCGAEATCIQAACIATGAATGRSTQTTKAT
jgi:hypothetical protein